METIMLSLSRQFRPHRRVSRPPRFKEGFTLIEVVIAMAVLGVMAAGCYIGFNAVNTYAVSSRLYSEAQTAAQNQVDIILSKEPFDISAAYISGSFNPALNKVPVEVMTTAELDVLASTGGVPFPTVAPTSTPAATSAYYPYYPYYRATSGPDAGKLKKQAFIYQDPVTGTVLVTGETTTTITDAVLSMTFINATDLNTRKAEVKVTYNFRGRDYVLSMGTLRTADQ